MTEQEYRSHKAISRSELWKLSDSPEKFKYYKDHPQPPTQALLFGQVVHKLVLQPEDFDSDFVIAPASLNLRTKAGREERDELLAHIGNKQLISLADYELASVMATKARTVPWFSERLCTGTTEAPFFWVDSLTGEECKCRTDLLWMDTDGKYTIVDYKSSQSAEIRQFNRSFFHYGYHLQAAMYSIGVKIALNLPELPSFVFVVQEKTEPYAVNIVRVTDDVMTYGMDVFRELIGTYHACKELDMWPGYMGFEEEISETVLPGWVDTVDSEDE